MVPGKVAHKMPFLSLNFGLTSKDLFFYDDAGGNRRILKSNQRSPAYRCDSCNSVLIVH
jgi:hypothetical protein